MLAEQSQLPEEDTTTPEVASYKPEDLVEQEGPNKGNIKDIELARIGAEAEDKKRAQKIRNWLGTLADNTSPRVGGHRSTREYTEDMSSKAGNKAMLQEVKKREKEAEKQRRIEEERAA